MMRFTSMNPGLIGELTKQARVSESSRKRTERVGMGGHSDVLQGHYIIPVVFVTYFG